MYDEKICVLRNKKCLTSPLPCVLSEQKHNFVHQKSWLCLQKLSKYVLPEETTDYFELTDIRKEGEILPLHPDEKPVSPPELSGNGFTQVP
jgi:hypothetical protein